MTGPIDIVSAGARTPLGLEAAPAAAAVRAGVTAAERHPFMVDMVGDMITVALDAQIDPYIRGPERLLLLAEPALRETCAPLNVLHATPPRLPIYLALPEPRPGFTHEDINAVCAALGSIEGLPADLADVRVFSQGHAAGWSALAAASEQIASGSCQACLVGGVDSYCHADTIEWLDANRQLAGAVSRSGFVPGEGAGFCLLMNQRMSERLGMRALARVSSVAVGEEAKLIKTSDICLGEGLTAVVLSAVSGLARPSGTIDDVICDINGERYRSEEWGFVCLRLSQYFVDPTAYVSPADCWGDVGAASGALFAMLVCQAASRGYSNGPRTLLWASSEGGLRGAAILETDNTD